MECYLDDTIQESANAAVLTNYYWKPKDDFTAPQKKADIRRTEKPTIADTAIVEIPNSTTNSGSSKPEAVATFSRTDDAKSSQLNALGTIRQHLRSMISQLEESVLSYSHQCDHIQRHFDEIPHQPDVDDDEERFQKWTKDIQRQPTSTADHVQALLDSGEQRKKMYERAISMAMLASWRPKPRRIRSQTKTMVSRQQSTP